MSTYEMRWVGLGRFLFVMLVVAFWVSRTAFAARHDSVPDWVHSAAEQKMPIEAMSSFIGGGAPRFWYSLSPEPGHPSYAQIVLVFHAKHDTHQLLPHIQERVSREIAGARVDVRQLETGDSVGLPVAIRLSGEETGTLRTTAERVKKALRDVPSMRRVRDDWGEDRFNVEININSDRANLAGLTNRDIAGAASTAVDRPASTSPWSVVMRAGR